MRWIYSGSDFWQGTRRAVIPLCLRPCLRQVHTLALTFFTKLLTGHPCYLQLFSCAWLWREITFASVS